jgi:ABC-type multidrug transport system ATPase subunit
MKQRVKLGLVLLDSRPLILLDEPSTNLDAAGKAWFFNRLIDLPGAYTVVIATNDPNEIDACDKVLDLFPSRGVDSVV